jgi:hypothetical protein
MFAPYKLDWIQGSYLRVSVVLRIPVISHSLSPNSVMIFLDAVVHSVAYQDMLESGTTKEALPFFTIFKLCSDSDGVLIGLSPGILPNLRLHESTIQRVLRASETDLKEPTPVNNTDASAACEIQVLQSGA